MLDRVRYKMV